MHNTDRARRERLMSSEASDSLRKLSIQLAGTIAVQLVMRALDANECVVLRAARLPETDGYL